MEELWFIFCTLGEMNMKEILAECQKQGWAPLMIVKQNNGSVMIPCFQCQETAIKFARRNLPKNQLFGSAKFPSEDIAKLRKNWVEDRGWILEIMNHPRLVRDLGEITVEVHEYVERPDIYGVWGRQTSQNIKPISLLQNEFGI
jgi:hypothetical protein